jgi:hypothetical protein
MKYHHGDLGDILAAFIIFLLSYIFKLAGISPSSGITSICL